MKYFIFSFLCFGVEAKRGVEFRQLTRYQFSGKWGVECLKIMLPLLTRLLAEYSIKLKQQKFAPKISLSRKWYRMKSDTCSCIIKLVQYKMVIFFNYSFVTVLTRKIFLYYDDFLYIFNSFVWDLNVCI